jgi:7-cyano-7-deazaguanine synthase in queuosine biosynthesis
VTKVFLRRSAKPLPESRSGDQIIDLLDDKRASNVDHNLGLIKSLVGTPSRRAQDLLALAVGVFVADKLVSRAMAVDAWTRDLALSSPCQAPKAWAPAAEALNQALNFLTGDRWILHLRDEDAPMSWSDTTGGVDANAACLFSGGADSLVGAVDTLERDRTTRLLLVGWYDTSQGGRQRREELVEELAKTYGKQRVVLLPLRLGIAQARSEQKYKLGKTKENSSRSRSLFYITLGIAAASAIGQQTPLIAPENGFIALNPPMTPARLGSLSTRTMHPYFLNRLGWALSAAGLAHPIHNPLALKTKGEVLAQCANQALAKKLFPLTVSCARSGRKETGRTQHSCGYCYPCIVRRSAATVVGWDNPKDYRYDVLRDEELFKPGSRRGADARAVFAGLQELSATRVLATGPLPPREVMSYVDLANRGSKELRAFFTGAKPAIRNIAAL